MKTIDRILAMLLAAAMALSLCACFHTSLPLETAPLAESTVETVPETQRQWTLFTGTERGYVYNYTEGRELEWEEDIIYMASNYLDDYGQLSHFPFRIEWPDDVEYSDQFYNEELRQYWIDETNAMIQDIPNMTDTQILYRIQKLVATLHDAHASVYLPASDYFPIFFQPFFREDGVDIYTVGIPQKYEELLFTKLDAINDIPIDEIIQRMEPYISYENDYWLISLLFGLTSFSYATQEDFLKVTGIMPEDADTVTFHLVSDSGEATELKLGTLGSSWWKNMGLVGLTPNNAYSLMYTNIYDSNYWYQYLPQEETFYVRINQFQEAYDYTFLTMGNEILKEAREVGGVKKLIVDIRDNPGGYQFLGYNEFVTVLQRLDIDSLYVLVDNNTFSNGIIMAGTIKRMLPEAILVGTPAGQPANFFAGMWDGDYVMPNSGTIIRIPTAFCVSLPDHEGDVLMPDVLIYPTIEDYKNSTDTILEAVLDMP